MKCNLGIATGLSILFSAIGANAQSVYWESTTEFDHGGQTAAATNGYGSGQEVEAHLGGYGGYFYDYPIWYDTALWDSGFGGGWEFPYPSGPLSFDSGFWLSAAGDSSTSSSLFAFAFSQQPGNAQPDSEGDPSFINYQTGIYSGAQLQLGNGYGTISQGFYPSIAEGTANGQTYYLEVQNGQNTSEFPAVPTSSLQLVWGELNSDGVSINWPTGNNPWSFGSGWYPSVAMWPINNNTFFVAVAYQQQSQSETSPLYMKVGQWTVGSSTINWTSSYNYADGGFPSVAVCARNLEPAVLMEVHNYGIDGEGDYEWAPIEGGWKTWPMPYYDGILSGTVKQPHVACNNWKGFESHNDNNGNIYTTRFYLD